MGWSFIFKRHARAACAIAPAAAALACAAWQCNFAPDQPLEFVQRDVPPATIRVGIDRAAGSNITGMPRLALDYLLYYQYPVAEQETTLVALPALPAQDSLALAGVLPAAFLNRGFALGYGDYVLGVAEFLVYDDADGNGAHDPGEPVIGCSSDYVLAYFQGTITQDLDDEFGGLQQGYNLCKKTAVIAGVDKFEVVSPAGDAVNIHIPKDPSAVVYPKVR